MKLFKSLFLASLLGILTLTSCEEDNSDCNCGIIVDDGIEFVEHHTYQNGVEITDYHIDHYFMMRNDCTNNTSKFYVTEETWFNNYTGDRLCFTNVNIW